jgi:hypothetical protein
MQAVRLKAFIDKNRELHLVVPGEVPVGPVEILLLSETVVSNRPRLSEVLGALGDHRIQSRQTLDARLKDERDSWE